MFGEQFYPTPKAVIDIMLAPHIKDWHGTKHLTAKRIIDPSAGKGDLLDRCMDYLTRGYGYQSKKDVSGLHAIEIDANLQAILRDKGYRVIGTDFLQYSDPYRFDLWLMNPPFRNGIDHLLHAWKLCGNGDIVCLLNANSIDKDTTKGKLLMLQIDMYGSVEMLGPVFKEAEHATDVNVALVRLSRGTKEDRIHITGLTYDKAMEDVPGYEPNAIMHRNPLRQLESHYIGARQAIIEQHEARAKESWFRRIVVYENDYDKTREQVQKSLLIASGKTNNEAAEEMAEMRRCRDEMDQESVGEAIEKSLAEQVDELKAQFWKYFFHKTKVAGAVDSKTRDEFLAMRDQTATLSFNYDNMQTVICWIEANQGDMRDSMISNVFDQLTQHHKKNTVHWEGWHTNSAYKINKKVIIPSGCGLGDRYWSSAYNKSSLYADIDKVLCLLAGIPFDAIHKTYTAINNREHGHDGEKDAKGNWIHVAYDEPLESTYFRLRLFKKGTVHLTFKDLGLLEKLNREAASAKGWLPGGRGY